MQLIAIWFSVEMIFRYVDKTYACISIDIGVGFDLKKQSELMVEVLLVCVCTSQGKNRSKLVDFQWWWSLTRAFFSGVPTL